MKELDDIIISLENLAELYSTISKNNPWSYCNPKSLLPADLREIELLIRDSLESLSDFRYEMNVVNEVYGIKIPNTLKEYEDSITALNILNSESANLVDSSVLLSKHWFNSPEKSLELIKLLQHYQHASGLFNKFSDYLLVADLDTIIYDLEKESNKKFKLFGGNSHKEELYKLYNGNVPSDREALNDLIKVRNHIKIRQSLKDNEALGRAYFGDLWSENANINAYKIVNGNLVYDSEEDARLQSLWASQEADSTNTVNVLNEESTSTTDTYSCDYINSELTKHGKCYGYNLTKVSDTLTTGSWLKIVEDFTTPVLPKGKYLIFFTSTLSGKGTGVATLNPALDGNRLGASTRQTIPICSLTTSGQCFWYMEFKSDSTHTVNIYQYSNVETTVSYGAVYFIKLV